MIEFIEIKSLEYHSNEVIVNNISVTNQHTYIANDYIVHNCTTAANTGVHYPLGSLIYNCNERRNEIKHAIITNNEYITVPKLIADGGFKNFDQMIKALALGADYVMLGDLLARTFTACGKIYSTPDPVPNYDKPVSKEEAMLSSRTVYREYYGMSTKKAQMEMGKTEKECRTAEGIIKYLPVNQFLDKWLDNFSHYLKSSMSYCNCTQLEEFIGFPCMGINTPMARSAFMK